ncbi:hypothetical protein [Ahrensia sp. R2A130]|uniref:hypothetical protein n=1 Tax=Ahrensia sp. R2A130 TaxID=744979 RepID=UPI0002F2A308|nr:hypothetical protein [Ahrensia sp. R2A130]
MRAPTVPKALYLSTATLMMLTASTALAQLKVPAKPLQVPGGKPAVNQNAPKTLDPDVRPLVERPDLKIDRPLRTPPGSVGQVVVVDGTGLAGEWTSVNVTSFVDANAKTRDTASRAIVDIKTEGSSFVSPTLDAKIMPLAGGYDALMARFGGKVVLTESDIPLPTALKGKPAVFTSTFPDGSTSEILLSGNQIFVLEGALVVPGTVAWSLRKYLRTGVETTNVAVLPTPTPTPSPVDPLDPNTQVNPLVKPTLKPAMPNVPVPAPLQASACQELDIVTGLLNTKGGTEMVQLVRGFYVEFGIAFNSQPTEQQCAATLDAMRRAGLNPSSPDGGLAAAQAFLTINPQPFVLNPPDVPMSPVPAAGSGCGAYFELLANLSASGFDSAVSLVVSLSGGVGGGVGGVGYDNGSCSRYVELFVEAGVNPQAPDGGVDTAIVWFEDNPQRLVDLAVEIGPDFEPIPAPDPAPAPKPAPAAETGPLGNYNPGPDTPDYTSGKTPDYAIYARPAAPGAMRDQPRDVLAVLHVTPDNVTGSYAASGKPETCDGPRRLSMADHMRAWASVREAMRWIGTPGEIVSSRECASVELAVAVSYATAGDPSYADGPDELIPSQMTNVYDNFENTAQNRAYALERISLALNEPVANSDPWRMVLAPKNAVSAFVRQDVEIGSTYVVDVTTGTLVATYRMSMPGD